MTHIEAATCCCATETPCPVCSSPIPVFDVKIGFSTPVGDDCCEDVTDANFYSPGEGWYEVPLYPLLGECYWLALHEPYGEGEYEDNQIWIEMHATWDGDPEWELPGAPAEGSWLITAFFMHNVNFEYFSLNNCGGWAKWQKEILAGDIPINCATIGDLTLVDFWDTDGIDEDCDWSAATLWIGVNP